jgi:hypothetical protein
LDGGIIRKRRRRGKAKIPVKDRHKMKEGFQAGIADKDLQKKSLFTAKSCWSMVSRKNK